MLTSYFEDKKPLKQGLPTVEYLAYEINLSPRYLGDMLRSLTGQNTQQQQQQHIHEKLIKKAKKYLSSTNLSINEIAFSLGFEYPQSFSKLFKNKVKVTPTAFR